MDQWDYLSHALFCLTELAGSILPGGILLKRILNALEIFGHVIKAAPLYCYEKIVVGIPGPDWIDNWSIEWPPAIHDDIFVQFRRFFLTAVELSGPSNHYTGLVQQRRPVVLVDQRSGPHSRTLENFDEAMDLFREYSFDVKRFDSSASFKEQISAVRSADIIFGAHGSFFVWAAFLKSESLAIEVQPYQFSKMNPDQAICYTNFVAKFRRTLLTIESLPFDEDITVDGRKRGILIPIEILKAELGTC